MKCRYFCRLPLDISPVYLTRGISDCDGFYTFLLLSLCGGVILTEVEEAVGQAQDQHQSCQSHSTDGAHRSHTVRQEEGNDSQGEADRRQQYDQVTDGFHLFHATFLLFLF